MYVCYFSFIDAKIENLYIHQRHCSLHIVYNLKSQTKQALLQLKARNKIYKGAKRHRGEQKSRRNDSGVKRLWAKGKVGETTQGRTGKRSKRLGFK